MRIAIFYHCRLFGGEPPIDPDYSIPLMVEQMDTLKSCGLLNAAEDMAVCVNGNAENAAAARCAAPEKARMIFNGHDAKSMLRTVHALREWSIAHPGWIVCFFHIKGVTHPGDRLNDLWRRCMTRNVILNWRQCAVDLIAGCDTVGAHWLTREKYGSQVTYPFWGGMFWWAQSKFLATLPELPLEPTCRQDWFLSENWIGMGRTPKVKDYAAHWPGLKSCS